MNEIVRHLARHGYSVLFASVFARQICLPVPAILFLLAGGAMAGNGRLNLALVVGLGMIASVLADFAWYQAGRLRPHVSATYPLERFEEAIAHAGAAGRRGAVKIAFEPQGLPRGGRR